MKKKIKLRDITLEQYEKWVDDNCLEEKISCFTCPFRKVQCEPKFDNCRVKNKDVYDKEFLNQEIQIEIKDPNLLTTKEKEYLEAILKPFKNRDVFVRLKTFHSEFVYIYIFVSDKEDPRKGDIITLPIFKTGSMYKGLEVDRRVPYTLEELGLFENLDQFKEE